MTHDDKTLWKLLDGELPEFEAQAITAAAKDDAALRGRIAELRALRQAMRDDAPTPPPGFASRVAALAARPPKAPLLDLEDANRFLRRLLVAAAILAALGVGYLVAEVVPTLFQQPISASPPDPLR